MYLYNKKLIKEFIQNKSNLKKITKVYIAKSIQNSVSDIILHLKQNNIPIHILDNDVFKKRFHFLNHQLIVLEYFDFIYSDIEEIEDNLKNCSLPIILLGYKIKDPRNLGSLMRVCSAFNIAGILITSQDSCSVNDTVIQASRNSKIKIHKTKNILKTINYFITKNYNIILLDKNGKNVLHELNYNFILPKSLVIVGGESGIPSDLINSIKNITNLKTVSIKIWNVESLNLTNAMAIFLYHFFYQKEIKIKVS